MLLCLFEFASYDACRIQQQSVSCKRGAACLLSVESGLLPCPDALKAAEENKENGTYIMMLPIAESKQ